MADRRADKDPYVGFRFRVDIDGISVASFKKVTIPDMEITVKDYREGQDENTIRKLSGIAPPAEITLEKGISDNMDLYNWIKDVRLQGCIPNRKNITITLCDEELKDGPSWNVLNAWPSKYSAGEFAADSDEVVIQTLTLVHEGCERTK